MVADVLVLRSERGRRREFHWPLTESMVLFLGMFAIYFAAACFLALVANVIYDDTLSRTENAQRVLFSRDPHLAAIGFVWNPLPIVALLPVLPLKFVWPQVITHGLAGDIVSALCMSGAILQVRGMLLEMALSRRVVLALTAAFAFHPLVFFFAANGMSEAMLLLFLLIAVRYLARWLRHYDLNSLITTGIALSLAYFTRYEALAGALGVITLVAVASLVRTRKQARQFSAVVCDVLIVGAPVAAAFMVWAIANWLITGHPFDRFSSIYSFGVQLPAGYLPSSRALSRLLLSQLASLEPLLPVVLLLGVVTRPGRHLNLALAAVACLGATLAFMVLAELNGSLGNDEIRYLILIVPLAVALAGVCAAGRIRRRRRQSLLDRTITFVCLLCVLGGLPVWASAMFSATVNPLAATYIQSIFTSDSDSQATSRRIAADLDRLNLSPGTVLVDDYRGAPIVASSNNPKQFVITSDRDFQSILADPGSTGVRYVLVLQPGGLGDLDAVNRRYPGLYENGAGFATLVREYVKQGVNDSTWRLYRIN